MTEPLLAPIRALHERIRAHVVAAAEQSTPAALARVAQDDIGDTIYAVDQVGEDLLVEGARELAAITPIVLIAEGLTDGPLVLPEGTPEDAAPFRILVDPVDGTRGFMYQKRSAWILTGVATNRGRETRLSDVELAVQTEIPLAKQYLCDVLWAVRGRGAQGQRVNRLTGETRPLALQPSRATTIEHGFAQIARFFPGAREELAAIDEEIAHGALGFRAGKALCFEDQYASTGGQLYELIVGHDRFTADLRPLMEPLLERRGEALGICAHPYDLCTELIAREAGVIVTDVRGEPLDCPLDLESDAAWAGYANEEIRREIEPRLQDALRRRGLLP